MFFIPIISNRKNEQPKPSYKWWGEPRAGGVESWKPTVITLKSGEVINCVRFYDFSANDKYIYLCEKESDTGTWAFSFGRQISKDDISNIVPAL